MSQNNHSIALALGSNIGDRKAALKAAIAGMAAFFDVDKQSPLYETAAAYVTYQPPFLNMVVTGRSALSPIELLRALKKLELGLGRTESFRYGPRLLDIDIIFCGDQILKNPELEIPHPRLHEREFVLRPLADIAPDWIDPARGLKVIDMLAQVPSASPICLGKL